MLEESHPPNIVNPSIYGDQNGLLWIPSIVSSDLRKTATHAAALMYIYIFTHLYMVGTGRGSSWLALVAPEIVTCPEDVIATFLETLLHLAVLLPLPAPASIKHTHTQPPQQRCRYQVTCLSLYAS